VNRRHAIATLLAVAAVPVVPAAPAAAAEPAGDSAFPTLFPLPNGFQPEGIAIGPGPVAFFGSRLTGSIYRADLRTGTGRIISVGPNTPSLGLKTDHRGRLFVSGGTGGDARVVSVRNGDVLARYSFATANTFVNDVILTEHAAWFTDSRSPVLYKLPLGRFGRLPAPSEVVKVPLSGDIVYVTPGTNANGIVTTPDGCALIIVQSVTGMLFRVDPGTGVARAVNLGGMTLPNGDGLLRDGRTLYVVQNRLNKIVVLRLDGAGTKATPVKEITDPRFDVPTTVAPFGRRLYLPNARFTTPPTPDTPYSVVAVNA